MLALGLTLLLLPATAAAAYYLALTSLGWLGRCRWPAAAARLHVTVVVPAHDEEGTLPATLRSLAALDYPPELLRVCVVADNCTDGTAAVACAAGAECVERRDPVRRGKGYALALGFRHALATPTDAVLVVDADCELAPDTLQRLAAALTHGAAVAQAAVLPRNPHAVPAGLVAGVGWQLENAVAAGLDRLGVAAGLRGTGMLFGRAVLETHPWEAFGPTEDAEYAGRLRKAGVRVRFVLDAEVRGEAPPTAAAFATQRSRWRAAFFAAGMHPVHKLLASKPLVLAHLAATLAVVAVALPWLPAPFPFGAWSIGLLTATAIPYAVAYRRGGYTAGGPANAARSVLLTARLVAVAVAGRSRGWTRTLRAAEMN